MLSDLFGNLPMTLMRPISAAIALLISITALEMVEALEIHARGVVVSEHQFKIGSVGSVTV